MLESTFESFGKYGLQLSKQSGFQIPKLQIQRSQSQKLISSFAGMMRRTQSQNKLQKHKTVMANFLDQHFILGQENSLILYKYELQEGQQGPQVTVLATETIQPIVSKIHVFARKYMIDKGQIPIIVETPNSLLYFTIELHKQRFLFKDQLKFTGIVDLNFFSQSELIVLTRDQLAQIRIVSRKRFVIVQRISNAFNFGNSQTVLNAKITGKIDEDRDCEFRVIFCTFKDNVQMIKVKEYERRMENGLNSKSAVYNAAVIYRQEEDLGLQLENCVINEIEGHFCIETCSQVLVIKKKFNSYLQLDTLVQKTNGKQLFITPEGVICIVSPTSFTLSKIVFGSPKCQCKLIDQITVQNVAFLGNVKKMWIFKRKKLSEAMFVFEKQGQILLANLVKMDPMDKLIELIELKGKREINKIQQLGHNLGIPRKQFYLNLWGASGRQINHIYQYLLPCQDIKSIKTEMRLYLKKRSLKLCQLIKVLDNIALMLHNQLKTSLSQDLVKEYAKNNFLRRKMNLYKVDKIVDCKLFDQIYNASLLDIIRENIHSHLTPTKQKVDPLSGLVQKSDIHRQVSIKHVMQEFKLGIIEHYKQFLIALLSEFPDRVAQVIKLYPYILPTYSSVINILTQETQCVSNASDEKEKTQVNATPSNSNAQSNASTYHSKVHHSCFSDIRNSDWQRQLNRKCLQVDLHKFYSTSQIASTIDLFLLKSYGRNNMLIKHSMVNALPQSFEEIVKQLTGLKVYLLICDLANRFAIKQNYKNTQAPQIVKVLKKHHKLAGQDLEDCLLYSQMHYLMLKHQIFEEQTTTVEDLYQTGKNPGNLTAMLLLGNRQKKKLILNEFRQLFCHVYHNSDAFNRMIRSFVCSENCSKIQLYILLDEITQKGPKFQVENQQLLSIVVEAFCMKLEIREVRFIDNFLKIVGQIEMDRAFAMKINEIAQLRDCLQILKVFKWETKTYDQILKDPKASLEQLMEDYFAYDLSGAELKIKEVQLSLEHPRNMLNLLLYFGETIFYDVSQLDILLIFGFSMVQWKQFETVRETIYKDKVPEKLDVCPKEYARLLVKQCLKQMIYNGKNIRWTAAVKEQTEMIISLLQQESADRVRQEAMVGLMELISGWGYEVNPLEIQMMTLHWKHIDRNQVMCDLVKDYIDSLDFRLLCNLYQLLSIIEKSHMNYQTDFQSNTFINYCLHFCDCLMVKSRYKEVVEVISYIKSFQNVPINYNLISEVFLQCITDRYRGKENTQKARLLVDYYTQIFQNNSSVKILFQNYFDESCLKDKALYTGVMVDRQLCFPQGDVVLKLIDVYEASYNICPSKTIYNYYYLSMALRVPQYALSRVHQISYSIADLINALLKLESIIDENPQYWAINISEFFKRLRRGLYHIGISRLQNFKKEMKDSPQEFQLQLIKDVLRKDKEQNGQLLQCIHTLQMHIEGLSAKVQDRKKRFEDKLNQAKRIELKNIVEQPEEDIGAIINVTLKYKELTAKKLDISRQYQYLSERQLIHLVFDQIIQNKMNQKNFKFGGMGLNGSISILSLGQERSRIERYCNLMENISNSQFDKISHQYATKQLEQALETVAVRPDSTIEDVLSLLQKLKIGDQYKIKLGKTFKQHNSGLSNSKLKQLFPFNFFLQSLKLDPGSSGIGQTQINQSIFESAKSNLKKVLCNQNIEEVLIIGEFFARILSDIGYKQKVVLLATEGIIETRQNTLRTLRNLRDYLRFLLQDEKYFIWALECLTKEQENNPSGLKVLRDAMSAIPRLPKTIKESMFLTALVKEQ